MNRILNVLFHVTDLFGERKRERLERKLLFKRNSAFSEKKALEAIADKTPDQNARLEKAEKKVEELQQRLPRGDIFAFIGFSIVVCALIFPVAFICHHGVVEKIWGSLDHPYLLRHRRQAVSIYTAGEFLASPFVFGTLLPAFLISLFFIQRRLQQRHARLLIKICTVILIVSIGCFAAAFFSLLVLPLCCIVQ